MQGLVIDTKYAEIPFSEGEATIEKLSDKKWHCLPGGLRENFYSNSVRVSTPRVKAQILRVVNIAIS